MSLPLKAVERLFDRLVASYGRDFWVRYEGLEHGAVKAVWAHELAGFAGNLKALAWGLESLPERPPNVFEFRKVCRAAPQVESADEKRLRLEFQPASRERVAAELAKLGPLLQARPVVVDPKDWARRLLARHDGGEVLKPIQLRFAREALGLPVKPVRMAA